MILSFLFYLLAGMLMSLAVAVVSQDPFNNLLFIVGGIIFMCGLLMFDLARTGQNDN